MEDSYETKQHLAKIVSPMGSALSHHPHWDNSQAMNPYMCADMNQMANNGNMMGHG